MSQISFSTLKIPAFRYLLLTRMFAITSTQAQAVIIGWLVYSLTGSTFMLGLTGLAEAVPAIFCALYAGHIVDISNPKRVLLLCLAALTINICVLFVFAGEIISIDRISLLWVIFGCIFVSGLARSFIMPSAFSLLPLIVKREDFAAASSWQTSAFQIAAISGPALAGIIYAIYDARGALFFACVMMFLSVLSLALLQVNYVRKTDKRPSVAKSISEGWQFLIQNKSLLSIMSLDMLAVLFGGAVAVLPAFADQVLHTGAEGLGLLRAAPAAGAILTALFFAVRPMKKITAVRMFIVVAGFGVCIIGFGFSTSLWMALFFLILSGAFDSISMVIRGTLMQLLTPENMRGRVSAVNSMFIISSNEIGAFYSGVMAALLGLVPSIVVGGAGTLAVVGLTSYLSKDFRKMSVDSTK